MTDTTKSDLLADLLAAAKDAHEFINGEIFDDEDKADEIRMKLAGAIAKAEGRKCP